MIVDKKRLERQQLVVERWVQSGFKGTFLGVTGVGKSFIAILCIQRILQQRPKASVLVVVPTTYLKDQWERLLKKFRLSVEVMVVNTASKTIKEVDFLIIDEVHTTGAESFSNVFDCISYKIILCLTATIERTDGNHSLILEKAPIFDEIGLEEALENGYISTYKIYNLPVELSSKEQEEYKKTQKNYLYYERLLGGKFSAWPNANQILRDPNSILELKQQALTFIKLVNKRKNLLHNCLSKIEVTKQILELFPDRKSVIFCESISFAERLEQSLNSIKRRSVLYHSSLTTKQKREVIKLFTDNRTAVSNLVSCRALDAGIDIPGINLGICCAGSSKQLQSIQRLGRSIRLNKDGTIAYYFNLYIPETQEEKWLKSRCYNIPGVEWIDNLNEI